MFRSAYYILISLFILIYLSSCGRIEKELFPLSPTIKEWASFQEGSYWIYQNDTTGTLDSVFVGFNGTEVHPSADGTHNVETVNTTITNTNDDLLGFIFGLGVKEIAFGDTGSEVEYDCAAGITIEKDDVKEEKITQGYYAWSVSQANDMLVHGVTYQNVVYIEVKQLDEDGKLIEGIVNKYWISKNNWIIKKVYSANRITYSWSLLRKNIKQSSL